MVTSNSDRVISGVAGEEGVPAADAHEIAHITYRQLDHWARQGWVRPTLDEGHGRAGRRRYSRSDVVRLDFLRHLAKSGVNLTALGPAVADLAMPGEGHRLVWGPLGVRDEEPKFRLLPSEEVGEVIERAGSWVVYSAERANRRFDEATVSRVVDTAEPTRKRRSA